MGYNISLPPSWNCCLVCTDVTVFVEKNDGLALENLFSTDPFQTNQRSLGKIRNTESTHQMRTELLSYLLLFHRESLKGFQSFQ